MGQATRATPTRPLREWGLSASWRFTLVFCSLKWVRRGTFVGDGHPGSGQGLQRVEPGGFGLLEKG